MFHSLPSRILLMLDEVKERLRGRGSMYRYAPSVASGVAITWIILEVLSIFRQVTAPPRVVAQGAAFAQTNGGVADQKINAVDIQKTVDAHLFGEPKPEGANDPSELPRAQVALVLTGTIAFEDPADGFAFVGENVANAKLYRAGAAVYGAVHLHSVFADRVVLEHENKLETLLLPRELLAGKSPATLAKAAVDGSDELLGANSAPLSGIVRLQPAFNKNKEQVGYRVFPAEGMQGIDKFLSTGLQPGDLLTAIDGTPVDSPGAGEELMRSLSKLTRASVTIKRGGKQVQLVLRTT